MSKVQKQRVGVSNSVTDIVDTNTYNDVNIDTDIRERNLGEEVEDVTDNASDYEYVNDVTGYLYELYEYIQYYLIPIQTCEDDTDYYDVSITFFSMLFIGIILVVSCVPPSFHYVNYDMYGLVRNNYGDVHLTPTLTQGRYFLPLNFGIVNFPADYQKVDFDSTVFADNGMEFGIHVKFYYRIPEDMVGIIYDRYSKSYGSRIFSNSKKIIKNSVTGFGIEDYLSNRSYIENTIARNISTSLEDLIGVIVPQEYVRIVRLDIPSILITTSLDSALALQRNELNQLTQVVSLVQSTTTELVATIDSNLVLLLQNADNCWYL